jgi:hypothetical protein
MCTPNKLVATDKCVVIKTIQHLGEERELDDLVTTTATADFEGG